MRVHGRRNRSAQRSQAIEAVKCISRIGCPVAAGECDKDGECYLWRCENPHAPKPEADEVAQFADLLLKVNAARLES